MQICLNTITCAEREVLRPLIFYDIEHNHTKRTNEFISLDELCCFDSLTITRNHKNRVHENVVHNDPLRKIVYIGILKFIIFHQIFSLNSF